MINSIEMVLNKQLHSQARREVKERGSCQTSCPVSMQKVYFDKLNLPYNK